MSVSYTHLGVCALRDDGIGGESSAEPTEESLLLSLGFEISFHRIKRIIHCETKRFLRRQIFLDVLEEVRFVLLVMRSYSLHVEE